MGKTRRKKNPGGSLQLKSQEVCGSSRAGPWPQEATLELKEQRTANEEALTSPPEFSNEVRERAPTAASGGGHSAQSHRRPVSGKVRLGPVG